MTQPEEKTFTQAEVDKIVRDRLARERDATATKYADYEELKKAAATADASKTQLDKVLEKLTAAEQRTAKLESANLRTSVASEKKLPAFLAKKLSGSTKEELEADADEMLSEWKASGGGGKATEDDGAGDTSTTDTATETTAAPRGRPKETLRSGAPLTEGKPEETDPMKLAALIPRH